MVCTGDPHFGESLCYLHSTIAYQQSVVLVLGLFEKLSGQLLSSGYMIGLGFLVASDPREIGGVAVLIVSDSWEPTPAPM